ncbi:cholesterol oxidase substrate-binding domain-containing protein [Streptomyces sp. NPDC026206]|uniref:cholesterol oxidase substrate-binding domain-containing protein n=1 Tax=Streptomyces sp. NPDC026206 TaxID=3157089 RepID=UPI003403B060
MGDEIDGRDGGETGRRWPARRRVLARGAAAGAVAAFGWSPAFRVEARAASSGLPPSFPPGIRLVRQAFRNWSGEVAFDAVWTAVPAAPCEVLALADWARAHGWRLRAKGMCHTFSPFLARAREDTGRLVLVDTTEGLTAVEVHPGPPTTVTAQAGATLLAIQSALEAAGLGLTCVPAIGEVTVGGVLAMGGHGTGVPSPGAGRGPAGRADSSTLSDAVESLTAVVWDPAAGRHVLRAFHRSEPDTAAFLVHLGRAFVTEATLRVRPNVRLRCRSSFDVPVDELFGPPGSGPRTLDHWLRRAGRVEALWLPYTERPWLKVWTEEPERPPASREIHSPYPYPFYDTFPEEASRLAREVTGGAAAVTPLFTGALEQWIRLGLTATASWDLWGWSKNTLLYLRATTVRPAFAGWAVLCARGDAQRVLHDFWSRLRQGLATHRARGEYPLNGPFDVRITATDTAAPDGPLLSAACPRSDHPEWDTVVWLNTTAFPGTPGADSFHHDLEQWMLSHFTGWAAVRPEWSKGWAYGAGGAWTEGSVLTGAWPRAFRAGRGTGPGWDEAVAVLERHDPARVFRGPFHDSLFPSASTGP